MKKFTIGILIFVFCLTSAFGAQFTGGFGFLHTNSSLIMPQGALDLSTYIRGYADFVEQDGENIPISNATMAIASTFGYTRNTELCISMILYQ